MLLLHTEVCATVLHKHIHLFKTAFIQQHGNTLTGRIFTLLMLLPNSLLATA